MKNSSILSLHKQRSCRTRTTWEYRTTSALFTSFRNNLTVSVKSGDLFSKALTFLNKFILWFHTGRITGRSSTDPRQLIHLIRRRNTASVGCIIIGAAATWLGNALRILILRRASLILHPCLIIEVFVRAKLWSRRYFRKKKRKHKTVRRSLRPDSWAPHDTPSSTKLCH